jgi:peptide/nickel transport system substrate-binding protein
VVDPLTVRYVAKTQYFKTLEALGTLPIVPKHIFEQGEPDFNKHPFGRAPVGTGPYQFLRWETGSQIVLERNRHYWNDAADPHYPDRIVYQVISEPYVAAQLLKKGELDVVDGMSPLQWQREMEGRPSTARLREIVYPFPSYSYLGFNLRRPMFQEVRVRHAIDLLIPRDEILSRIYLDKYASKATGWNLASSPANNPAVQPTPYDPALAAQLLRAAGWQMGADGLLYKNGQQLAFRVMFGSGNDLTQKIAELIQESLQRAGIAMSLERIEFAQLVAQLDDWNFDACMLGRTNDVNEDPFPSWDGSQAMLKHSANDTGYASPVADRLIDAGRREYDDAKRNAIWQQLQQVVHDDYPVCFLFNSRHILLVSNRYQNVQVFAPIPCFDATKWWVPGPEQRYP